jgi:beta-glucanase (GH16 family)
MKRILFTAILAGITALGHSQAQKVTADKNCRSFTYQTNDFPQCNPNPYKLIFEDDFDGNAIDPSKWNPKTGMRGKGDDFSQSKQWFQPQNTSVNSGQMHLIAKQEYSTHTYTVGSDPNYTMDFNYTSGEMWSKYKFNYGKYEIRCKMPVQKGFFPSFWLFQDLPVWAELDIFDLLDLDTDQYSAGPIYGYDDNDHPDGCRWSVPKNKAFFLAWHTYTCIFEPDMIIWQIDGQTITTAYKAYKTVPNVPMTSCGDNGSPPYTIMQQKNWPIGNMKIITSLAIRSETDNKAPDVNTVFPSQMDIDYIRAYKKIDCSADRTFTTLAQLNLDPDPLVYNFICGKHITFDGNITVPNPQNLTVSATHSIDFKPGFTAEPGTYINAYIKPDPLSLEIGGPRKGNNTTIYTWFAIPVGGNDPYTYLWEGSQDGGISYSSWGSGSSVSAQLPDGRDLDLRLTVFSPDGQTAVSTAHVANFTRPRPTSINEEDNSEISVFPNPTNAELNINLSELIPLEGIKIVVLNAQGKIVIEKALTSRQAKFDFNEYSNGIYLIRIIDEKNTNLYVKKIIKQ